MSSLALPTSKALPPPPSRPSPPTTNILPPPPPFTKSGLQPSTRPLVPRPTSTAIPSAKSHQSGAIESHWNDLPTSFLSTTSSAATSEAASRAASPLPETFSPLLERLFTTSPSTLPERERQQLLARAQRAKVTDAQKRELSGVLGAVLDGDETPAWGRERVVEFMMRQVGVAGWAMAVRRGVESVKGVKAA